MRCTGRATRGSAVAEAPGSGSEADLTATGILLGTATYMSPEQILGGTIDARSDLFSLGVVLYEALSGTAPFRRDSAAATIAAVLTQEVPPPPDAVEAPAEELARSLERIAAGVPAEAPATPSVAVLAFRDMSAARDQDYFCEGVADEVLHSLTRVEGLRVAARSSPFQFAPGSADVREVAERLAVGHVLEGSVRRDGERLRVTVQLIDAGTGAGEWDVVDVEPAELLRGAQEGIYEPIDYSGIDREALLESARHPDGSCRPTSS